MKEARRAAHYYPVGRFVDARDVSQVAWHCVGLAAARGLRQRFGSTQPAESNADDACRIYSITTVNGNGAAGRAVRPGRQLHVRGHRTERSRSRATASSPSSPRSARRCRETSRSSSTARAERGSQSGTNVQLTNTADGTTDTATWDKGSLRSSRRQPRSRRRRSTPRNSSSDLRAASPSTSAIAD